MLAHGFDYTTDFISHHTRLWRRVRIQALARKNVGEVQSGCTHADDNLIRGRCRVWLFLHLQDVDVAGCGGHDLSHRPILSVLIAVISDNLWPKYATNNPSDARLTC